MARLIGILVATLGLAACSSGVSNTGAGAQGTNCLAKALSLICTGNIILESRSIDAFQTDNDGDGFADELLSTDIGQMNITITDPLGQFDNTFQGATFETYDISYNSGQGGAPNLGQRRFTSTLSIELSNSTGQGSISIPIVDLITKRQFAMQTGGSGTVYPYVVTVRATGQDFATNTQMVVVARTNIEIGDFTDSPPQPPEEEEENGEENGEEMM